jgi:hypothetical protein
MLFNQEHPLKQAGFSRNKESHQNSIFGFANQLGKSLSTDRNIPY